MAEGFRSSMHPASSCGETNGVFNWLLVMRQAKAGTCFTMELFFRGLADQLEGGEGMCYHFSVGDINF